MSDAVTGRPARWRDQWAVGLAWGGVYLVLVVAVVLAEVSAQLDRLDRYAYNGTFDALLYARFVTSPLALLVPPTTRGDRAALHDAAWWLAGAGAAQAVALGLAAMTLSWLTLRRSSDPRRP